MGNGVRAMCVWKSTRVTKVKKHENCRFFVSLSLRLFSPVAKATHQKQKPRKDLKRHEVKEGRPCPTTNPRLLKKSFYRRHPLLSSPAALAKRSVVLSFSQEEEAGEFRARQA